MSNNEYYSRKSYSWDRRTICVRINSDSKMREKFQITNHASLAFSCHKISAHDGWLMHNIKIFWFLVTYGIKKIVCVVYSTDMEESDVRSLHELGIQKPSTGKLLAKLLCIA